MDKLSENLNDIMMKNCTAVTWLERSKDNILRKISESHNTQRSSSLLYSFSVSLYGFLRLLEPQSMTLMVFLGSVVSLTVAISPMVFRTSWKKEK